jgi:hypothetical protein
MDILAGLGAVSGLLQSTTSFVQALKQPRVTDEAFSEIFKAQLAADSSPEAQQAKALKISQHFVALRDVDGDGALRLDESGFTSARFATLDKDGDGNLSAAEIQANLAGQEVST